MTRAGFWAGGQITAHNPTTWDRVNDVVREINQKPDNVIILRDSLVLPVQVVRIEPFRHPFEQKTFLGEMSEMAVVVLGVKNHPTIPTLDMKRGDRFKYNGLNFFVLDCLTDVPWRVIGIADVKD
jgi:hypothetical protein